MATTEAAAQHHLALQVTVQDLLIVEVLEGEGDLEKPAQDLVLGERLLAHKAVQPVARDAQQRARNPGECHCAATKELAVHPRLLLLGELFREIPTVCILHHDEGPVPVDERLNEPGSAAWHRATSSARCTQKWRPNRRETTRTADQHTSDGEGPYYVGMAQGPALGPQVQHIYRARRVGKK